MDLIRIKHVEKKYRNGVTAIYDLNLAIEKGSFVFVIGGSGSGKSTLIKMLYREEKPDWWEICRRFLADEKDFDDIGFIYNTYWNEEDSTGPLDKVIKDIIAKIDI